MKLFSLYKKHRQSVKSKLIVNVIVIHAILMGLVVFDLTQREQAFMQKQLSQKGYELTSLLASNASVSLLNNDLVALDELLFDMNTIKDHYMIFILDKHARVRASTKRGYVGRYLDDKLSQKLLTRLVDDNLETYQEIHNNIVDTIHAVKIKNNVIGYTRTLMDRASLSKQMKIIEKKAYLYIFIAILIGAFFAWLVVRRLTERLNRVSEAAQRIANQDFNVILPTCNNNDELSQMIDAFNIMSRSINGYIYELQKSTKRVQESEQKLLEAQEIAHVGSWDLDLRTSVIEWSPEVYNIRGRDPNTYVPTLEDYFSSLDEEDKIAAKNALDNTIASGKKTEVETKVRLDDGSVKYIHLTALAHYDSKGKAYKVTGTTQDITQHKEDESRLKVREKQLFIQSRLAQMGEMISMIAHQWRQPLGAIAATSVNLKVKMMLNTFDLQTKEGQEECKEYYLKELNDIEVYVQTLSTTIDDFRNFYKINKKSAKVKIDTVIIKALNIIKSSLENDSIDVVYEANSTKEIEMYDGEVMQVVLNILKNSQDNFKEKIIKNPTIKITSQNRSIEIYDNGGGISDDIIEKIFDPYFSSKSEKNGTGLGLYMSKIIIEDHHNGVLKAENNRDGVSFYIELNK